MDPTAILTGLGIGAGLYALAGEKKTKLSCYERKSEQYRRCMTVPVADQSTRQACFEKADAELDACLGQFSGCFGNDVSQENIYRAVELQIAAATDEAAAAAERAARAGAEAAAKKETAKFWKSAAWIGVGGLALFVLLKRR